MPALWRNCRKWGFEGGNYFIMSEKIDQHLKNFGAEIEEEKKQIEQMQQKHERSEELIRFVADSNSVIANLNRRIGDVNNSIGNIEVRVMGGRTAEEINKRKEEISKDLSNLQKDIDFIIEFAKLFNEEAKELQTVIQDSKSSFEL